MTVSLFLT